MAKLSYTDTGKGATIVLIHGLGAIKESWAHQQPLVTNFRLISMDLRGHGQTAENKKLTIKNFAADVIELIDDLNIKSAIFCGLSLGGIVAQEIHVQRSELVAGLILASTTSWIPYFYKHIAMAEATRAFKDGSLLNNIVKRGLVDKSFNDDAKKAFLIRENYLDAARSVFGLNYFWDLRSIQKPVLLIGGRQDKVLPINNVSYMHACLKDSEIRILENTGHLCNIESAKEFNQAVGEFVSVKC